MTDRARRTLVKLGIGLGLLAVVLVWRWPEAPNSAPSIERASEPSREVVTQPPRDPQPTFEPRAASAPPELDDEESSGTVPTGHRKYLRVVSVQVEDQLHHPIGQATVSTFESVCRTDGSGRCRLEAETNCKACPIDVTVSSPGWARVEQQMSEGDHLVTLEPERRLKVTLDAPGTTLLSALTILVRAPDDRTTTRQVDTAGTTTITELPSGDLEVQLVDQLRPLASARAPDGVDTVTFHLVPRRLDVQVELDHPVSHHHLCKVIDLRCGSSPRLLANVSALGSKALSARFEYAPSGPCRVALSYDCSRSIETEPSTEVTPPTAVTLYSRTP